MMKKSTDQNSQKDDWERFQSDNDEVREIILMYKTKACNGCEDTSNCFGYHSNLDSRRGPFSFTGKISYLPIMCNKDCSNNQCKLSHNIYEIEFHPWFFKTNECEFAKGKSNQSQTIADFTSGSIFKCLPNSLRGSISSLSYFNGNSASLTDNLINASCRSSIISKTPKSYLDQKGSFIPSSQRGSKISTDLKNFSLKGVSSQRTTGDLSQNTYHTQIPIKPGLSFPFAHNEKFCPFYHSESDKRQSREADLSDTLTIVNLFQFKTELCEISAKHCEKKCTYFHSSKDRRRNLYNTNYTSETCGFNDKNCIYGDFCKRSHSQVEVLYHIDKFKTRFCCHYDETKTLDKINEECPYGSVCSFVHCESELRIELIHRLPKNEGFFIYYFKTVICPFDKPHDKAACVYAHNFQDFRRSPINYIYDKRNCQNWNNKKMIMSYNEGCEKSYSCPFSHGWKEQDYHPLSYKTLKCKYYMEGCDKGENCPYFHTKEIKRYI